MSFSDLEAALKRSAAALRGAGVPFLLGGSLASWARGGWVGTVSSVTTST